MVGEEAKARRRSIAHNLLLGQVSFCDSRRRLGVESAAFALVREVIHGSDHFVEEVSSLGQLADSGSKYPFWTSKSAFLM